MKPRRIILGGGILISWLAIAAISQPGITAAQQQPDHTYQHAQTNQKNPLAATAENITQGRALYGQNCAVCHGEDGKAMTAKASAMKVHPADLTQLHEMSDGGIFQVITRGIAPSGMPAFKDKLGEQERWQIAMFVQQFQQGHVPMAPMAQTGKSGQPPQHQHQQQQASTQAEQGPHADHAGMSEMNGMEEMMTTVTGGPYRSMRALGSGTALQPASTPMSAWHWMPGDWTVMLHGDFKFGYNQQGGPRGVGKAESENWLMLMAERKAGSGRLMLRGMISAEPLTAPHGGFPELFQTGESYRRRPLIDAQHPHDLFMELAASYTIQLSENTSVQFYGGPVGEPALGPVAFMHRASASENPAAPLGHHWQDSTHITHGVVTGAITVGKLKFEASGFHGAEPDEDRVAIDLGRLDSYSFRGWFTPTQNWAMQFSYGHLSKPEVFAPSDLDRMTASISYNRPLANGNWASSLIWGRNSEEHGNSNSYLFESTINFFRKNHLYTRLELVDKGGLLSDNIFGRPGLIRAPLLPLDGGDFRSPEEFERAFRVGAFTFGGVRDFIANEMLRVGVGADVTFYHKPAELDSIYGRRPVSYHVFLRFRPGEMR